MNSTRVNARPGNGKRLVGNLRQCARDFIRCHGNVIELGMKPFTERLARPHLFKKVRNDTRVVVDVHAFHFKKQPTNASPQCRDIEKLPALFLHAHLSNFAPIENGPDKC